MSVYNFKKEVTIYVVYGDSKFNVTPKEISFSQDINLKEVDKKTTHSLNSLFPKVKFEKFSSAKFTLPIYAIRQDDYKVLFNRALDCETFDLYIVTKKRTFKLRNCIITNAQFITEVDDLLGINFIGEASELSSPGDQTYAIPGTEVPRASSTTYNRPTYTNIQIGTTLFDGITRLSFELQNRIEWVDEEVVENCNAATVLAYPETFIIKNKILSGSFTTVNIGPKAWSNSDSLSIVVGDKVGPTVYGFEVNASSISYSTREVVQAIFGQSYDWRLTQNPDSMFEVLNYKTLEGVEENAILDHLNDPILDYRDEAILETI